VIVVLDGGGRILRANPYLRNLTGHRPHGLEGRSITDIISADDRKAVRASLARLAQGHYKTRGVHRLLGQGGRLRMLAWSARLMAGAAPRPGHRRGLNQDQRGTEHHGSSPPGDGLILFIGNDVTELHEAQERALQVERLAAIGQMAAGLAHESRNALQRSQACLGILGFRLAGQPESLELVARAQGALDDLHRLYEDVREYAAAMHLEPRPCNLGEVWREAWQDLEPMSEDRNAVLVEQPSCLDLECMVSPFHLKRVFRNLFENALAAAGVGTPRITITCTEVELDGREAIEMAIQDNGPGFAEDERRRAFEAFFTTKVRGTGLGLAICKRIVEAHGGRIEVGESTEPGALLILTLPRQPREPG
jgi:PAS domain S-box-containing protein